MSNKKRQHFVPQFYLRLFPVDASMKGVGVFNLNTAEFIPYAPIKRQAYKNYFYGKDPQREEILEQLEGCAASIINRMISENILPGHSSGEHGDLMAFVLSLMARTEFSVIETNREIYEIFQVIYSQKFAGLIDPASVKLDDTDAVIMSVAHAFKALPIVQDLQFKLLLNRTQLPFITSDNPVIRYNQYLESRTPHHPITGLAASGIQIFLPISPNAFIMFYDPKIYKVGSRSNCCIDLEKESDIHALNLLQFGNAYQNIYFSKQISENFLRSLYQQLLDRPLRTQPKGSSFQSRINQDQYLVPLDKSELRANLKLSFVRLIRRAKKKTVDPNFLHTRSERVERLVKELSTENR